MEKSIVFQKAYAFSIKVVITYQILQSDKKEYILSKQFLRSGTSIGPNIAEANGAISKADFSAKMSIAYKESLETKYWVSLLKDTDFIDKETSISLLKDVDKISRILFSILKSTRIKN